MTRRHRKRGSSGRPAPRAPWSAALGPAKQARNHRRTREAHAAEVAEDYVEVIADLIRRSGEARAVEIARRLGVTHVTVAKTIARLRRTGLVTSRPYRSIFLTESGRQLAELVRRRHQTVTRFLQALGVGEATSHADAEGIEHHVSHETLAAFERFLRSAARPDRHP